MSSSGNQHNNGVALVVTSETGGGLRGGRRGIVKWVVGDYFQKGFYNDRPCYQKDPTTAERECYLFFWEDGWYFGDHIGSSRVWAFGESVSSTPPQIGWRIPADAKTIEKGILEVVVTPEPPSEAESRLGLRPVPKAAAAAVRTQREPARASGPYEQIHVPEVPERPPVMNVQGLPKEERDAILAVRRAAQQLRAANSHSFMSLAANLTKAFTDQPLGAHIIAIGKEVDYSLKEMGARLGMEYRWDPPTQEVHFVGRTAVALCRVPGADGGTVSQVQVVSPPAASTHPLMEDASLQVPGGTTNMPPELIQRLQSVQEKRAQLTRAQYDKMMKSNRRSDEDLMKRQEHASALVVKKAIQRLRLATRENWTKLAGELEQIHVNETVALGSLLTSIDEEVSTALKDASSKFDPFNRM